MEEYVIKNLTTEHGAEIIQHFKDLGIDTKHMIGSYNRKDRNQCIYYGVINGVFSNYSLTRVQETNTPIRELPKRELKMYSIKEIETNENLVVYLDSKDEWNNLEEITKGLCGFYGKHCYSLWELSFSVNSTKTNVGGFKKATIITYNQIKELNMTKKLIGYKLIKPEYETAAVNIVGTSASLPSNCYELDISIKKLKDAGVLDLWFEPVYKTEEKIYTLGINEKFNISVKDKKAFYKDEDVTETLLTFQKTWQFTTGKHKIGKYDWHIGDTIIKSVGCITKKSLLSQWLSIDLT